MLQVVTLVASILLATNVRTQTYRFHGPKLQFVTSQFAKREKWHTSRCRTGTKVVASCLSENFRSDRAFFRVIKKKLLRTHF